MYARLKKGFPSGGSWRRRRLMRGDKSALAQHLQNLTPPPTKRARQPHFAKTLYRPKRQKLPPRAPAPCKTKQLFAMKRRVLLGEVLGGSGRFGGRGTPLSRGVPLPPRSSSLQGLPPPRSFKPSDTARLRATRANRRRGRRLTRFSRSGRRREHGNASQRSRACRLWRDSRP